MLLQPIFALMASAAIITFLIQRKHFLMTLLSLEAITLISVGLMAASMGSSSELDISLFIIVISFAAVEASLGLSILVSMSRKAGSELLKSLTSSKC